MVGGEGQLAAQALRLARQRLVARAARPGLQPLAGCAPRVQAHAAERHAQAGRDGLAVRRPALGQRLQAVVHMDRMQPDPIAAAGQCVQQHAGVQAAAEGDQHQRGGVDGGKRGLTQRRIERRENGCGGRRRPISVLRRSP
jgi:hypothetical protein